MAHASTIYLPERATRVAWVDLARGLGIALVVFGHVWRGLEPTGLIADPRLFRAVDAGIYLFHMPLFFFLSGVFFRQAEMRRGPAASFRHRVIALLYPLAIWSTLLTALQFAAAGLINGPAPTAADFLPLPPRGIFWFLWSLFLVQTAVSLLLRLPPPAARPAAAIALAAASWLASLALPGQDPWLREALAHLPYFLMGMALAPTAPPRPWLATGALAALAVLVANATIVGATPAAALAAGAACVLCVAIGARWLEAIGGGAWLCALGQWSMAIYLAHVPFTAGARILLTHGGLHALWLHLAAGTALGIAGPLALRAAASRLGARRLLGF
jgi:fucose 4-O-acetylase-like acetyltransferase